MFPKSGEFDYQQLFKDNVDNSELEKYSNSELTAFVENFTSSQANQENQPASNSFKHSRELKRNVMVLRLVVEIAIKCASHVISNANARCSVRIHTIMEVNALGVYSLWRVMVIVMQKLVR